MLIVLGALLDEPSPENLPSYFYERVPHNRLRSLPIHARTASEGFGKEFRCLHNSVQAS